jgi:predicted  nucleic acid-binding Zn-ribbon protein
MKYLIPVLLVLLSGCSVKELVYDMTDDEQMNALEADIDAIKEAAKGKVDSRIDELRERLNAVRDAAKDRREALAKELAEKIEAVRALK